MDKGPIMFKRIIFMLAIAALFTSCEDEAATEIPDITGYWIHSSSEYTISLADSVVDSGTETYPTNDPLNYDMVLQFDADSIYSCENDPYATGYSCEAEAGYEINDSTIFIYDDEGTEEVPYTYSDNTLSLTLDEEEEGPEGVVYDRHSIETFVSYSGTFPPAEWTTAQDNPAEGLIDYWLMASETWTEHVDGVEVDSGSDVFNTTDPYEWEEIIHITADSIIFCTNDPYSDGYMCESDGAYYVEGDTIFQTIYDDSSGSYEVQAIPFTLSGDNLSVSVVEEHQDSSVTIVRRSEIELLRYTGTFPPEEWTIPIVAQSVTVSLDGGTSVTYDNPNSMQAAYLVTGVEPVPDSTFYIVAADGSTSSIFITFKGAAAGTYDVAAMQGMGDGSDNFNIVYAKSETEMYGLSRSGSVIVTAFGAVGELVEGTYDAFVAVFVAGAPTADSVQVAGSFSVVRAADGTSLD